MIIKIEMTVLLKTNWRSKESANRNKTNFSPSAIMIGLTGMEAKIIMVGAAVLR